MVQGPMADNYVCRQSNAVHVETFRSYPTVPARTTTPACTTTSGIDPDNMRRFAIWAVFALILYWLVTHPGIRPTTAPTWTSDIPTRPADIPFHW